MYIQIKRERERERQRERKRKKNKKEKQCACVCVCVNLVCKSQMNLSPIIHNIRTPGFGECLGKSPPPLPLDSRSAAFAAASLDQICENLECEAWGGRLSGFSWLKLFHRICFRKTYPLLAPPLLDNYRSHRRQYTRHHCWRCLYYPFRRRLDAISLFLLLWLRCDSGVEQWPESDDASAFLLIW